MNMLKHTTVLPLIVLLTMSLTTYSADVDRTLAWDKSGEINVDITAGQIEFRGWGKDEVKLSGDFDGDNNKLVFKKDGRSIKIQLKDESKNWWGSHSQSHADFTVFTPFDSNLDIDGTSLRIEVDNVKGRVDINSISGSVRLNGPSKRVDVETVSGDIDVSEASGKMRLRSISGDINVDVAAYSFDAKTVSGNLEGQIRRVESARFLSVSGDVDVELTLSEDGRVEGQTVSGNLELNFNNDLSADFELNTGPGGNISNKLSDDLPANNHHWGQELRFTKGNGNGNVELETMNGAIKVR